MNESEHKMPDLVFIYPKGFSSARIEQELEAIEVNGLNLKIKENEGGPYAAFEWIIPTAFGAYLLKPYFDSFLSEAGKDHYNLLKKALNKLIRKGKEQKVTFFASTNSPDKLSTSYSQSGIVSLDFQTIDHRHLRLLFDDNLQIEDWQNALAQMLDFLERNYTSYPEDFLTLEITKLNSKPYNIIYATINPETKRLEFRDDRKMLEKYK